ERLSRGRNARRYRAHAARRGEAVEEGPRKIHANRKAAEIAGRESRIRFAEELVGAKGIYLRTRDGLLHRHLVLERLDVEPARLDFRTICERPRQALDEIVAALHVD